MRPSSAFAGNSSRLADRRRAIFAPTVDRVGRLARNILPALAAKGETSHHSRRIVRKETIDSQLGKMICQPAWGMVIHRIDEAWNSV